MAISSVLIAPVIALVLWSAVIFLWMYATRIPAIIKMRMVLDGNAPRGEQMAQLPTRVRWKADNYNHLMEQPTLFYATALALALLGDTSSFSITLAWAYVALRIVHSLVQVLVNHIPTRFAIFFISSMISFVLAVRAAWLLI